MEAMQRQKSQEELAKEKQKKQFEKKLKEKSRYAKQLTRTNKKGQMVMSNMISHLLGKIERTQPWLTFYSRRRPEETTNDWPKKYTQSATSGTSPFN